MSAPMDSLLLRQFRQFYAEAARRSAAMAQNAAAAAASAGSDSLTAGASDPVHAAFHSLLGWLQAQADEAAQRAGVLGARAYQEMQYVEAALADEMFLLSEAGSRWPLLETALFHTQSAGETIFDRIDALLARGDQAYADIAAIYFWALALGFEGKYRGLSDQRDLQTYRQKLFHLLYRDRPRLFDPERALFPQAYLHNLEEGSGRRLPNPRIWMGVLVLVLVVWWGAAQLGWNQITAPIETAVCHINPHARGCEAAPTPQPSIGLGQWGPQPGASINGSRGEAALGPAPVKAP